MGVGGGVVVVAGVEDVMDEALGEVASVLASGKDFWPAMVALSGGGGNLRRRERKEMRGARGAPMRRTPAATRWRGWCVCGAPSPGEPPAATR